MGKISFCADFYRRGFRRVGRRLFRNKKKWSYWYARIL